MGKVHSAASSASDGSHKRARSPTYWKHHGLIIGIKEHFTPYNMEVLQIVSSLGSAAILLQRLAEVSSAARSRSSCIKRMLDASCLHVGELLTADMLLEDCTSTA